ncbi:MAG: hypothetical protein K8R21_15350 [Leptospira sp.]|nr:hypothetical protein [Leptospira sp.]
MKFIKSKLIYLFLLTAFFAELFVFGTSFTVLAISVSSMYGDPGVGAGRFFEVHPLNHAVTKIAEGTIKFGYALQLGTTGDQAKKFTSSSGKFIGVAGYSTDASDLDNEQYSEKDPLGCVEIGVVMVYVEEAVAIGDPVRVRHTDHASDVTKLCGMFAKTADEDKTALLEGASWKTAATAAGLVPITLNGPFKITADNLS